MSTTSTASFLSNADGTQVATYTWAKVAGQPAGVVQIAHGLAEHGARYDRFAQQLNAAGFVVHAVDHRGHGRTAAGRLGDFGAAGFGGLIADVAQYGSALRAQHGSLPVFLFAHSMGSFAAQAALLDHASIWAGAILSGSTALDALAAAMANAPADAPSGLAAFNAGFAHRTGYEWLSRDAAEVDAYVADPWCGWEVPGDVIPSLFAPAARLADPALLAGIRSDLPLLIASGDADPLAGGGALIELLGQRYRDAGIADVTVKLYPAARHEILNETNRDEVTADIVAWLRAHAV
ncbi:alpha-beta hydrolase superfamily lysophospholipase [Acidovorax soli]|uniref:Alpha-beta hydrolase superfamily lysophospholipase n=1 Tax=Acidovorax soli TaxID=592050 RepID=A0A7X0U9N9_9BURK|nr:alpha/beta hydrolase [Acidovorax soli]MBB6560039.1 alpha-beta hydrolase superfamily lysophospholipase [Acidovorax soli]